VQDDTPILSETQGRVALIRLNRPRQMNALNDALMDAWGYTSMRKVQTLRERIVATNAQTAAAVDELTRLAMHAYVSRPALALAWSNYISSDRMPAVFTYEGQSNSIRLAPRRSGDLRECALELVNLTEIVAHVRSEQLL